MKGKQFVNFLAYISIALIAVALFLGKILGWLISPNIVNALNIVAQVIAYSITAAYAFIYAKSKRSNAWMVAYIIFVIVIIVFMVLVNM